MVAECLFVAEDGRVVVEQLGVLALKRCELMRNAHRPEGVS
jgi:hypothetical protein